MNSFFASFICLFIRNKKRKQFLYDFLTKRIEKDAEKEVIDALYSGKDTKNINDTLFLNRLNDKTNDLKKAISNVDNRMAALKVHQDLMFMTLYKGKEESLLDAKKRFFLNLPPAEGMMRKAQLLEAYLLKNLHRICTENNLTYFLSFGTLLGAVRHEGFIPWDDDMDIIMPRQDLERLMEILKDNPDFWVRSLYVYDRANVVHAVKFAFRDIEMPLFFDIFVVDYTDDPETEVAKTIEKWRGRLYSEAGNQKMEKGIFSDKRPNQYNRLRQLYTEHKDKAYSECRINKTKGRYLIWAFDNFTNRNIRFGKTEDIFPAVQIRFEGNSFNVPSNHIQWLENYYGDIYTLPMDLVAKKHYKLSEIHKNNINKLYKKYS